MTSLTSTCLLLEQFIQLCTTSSLLTVAMLSVKQSRQPTIFDGPLAHSLRLLQGLERAVPPPFDSPSVQANAKTLKPLPAVPYPPTGNSYAATQVLPPRSPSVDQRSPGAWEPPPSWSHNAQQMLEPSIEYTYRETFSTSSPQLTNHESSVPVRVPRSCAPLLPEPSPILAATSRKSFDQHVLTQLPPSHLPDDHPWFAHSPTSTEAEFLEQPSPVAQQQPQSQLYFRSRSSSVSLPSPSVDIDTTLNRTRSSSPPLVRLARFGQSSPWSQDIGHERAAPSLPKGRRSPGIVYLANDNFPSVPNLTSPPNDKSIEKALSNLGRNEDGSEFSRGRKFTRTHNRVTPQRCGNDDRNRSGSYHDVLVEQYRALAAPTVGQWDDSSDGEDEATSCFRLIPKPLFWQQRDRDESRPRMEERPHRKARSQPTGRCGRRSHTPPPPKLPDLSHFRSKSDEAGQSAVTDEQDQSPAVRSFKWLPGKRSKEKNDIGTFR